MKPSNGVNILGTTTRGASNIYEIEVCDSNQQLLTCGIHSAHQILRVKPWEDLEILGAGSAGTILTASTIPEIDLSKTNKEIRTCGI